MGFFSKKKKQPSNDDRTLAPSTSTLRSTSPDLSQSSSSHSNQRQGSHPSTSRFNPFRSSSASSSNPPSPSANNSSQDPSHRVSNIAPSSSGGHSRDPTSNLRVDTRRTTRHEGGWEDLGVPLTGSPVTFASQHHQHQPQQSSPVTPSGRFKLFNGGGGSTVSLPLPQASMRQSMDQETLREHQYLRGEQQAYEMEVEKKSRWKLGMGAAAKRRSGSVGSTLSMQQATGSNLGVSQHATQQGEEEGGFFVRSFRTVSRVQDPISTGPYESLRPAVSPPLPSLPPPSPQQYPSRPSLDYEPRSSASTTRVPQRPPLNTRASPGSGSWTNGDRAPSPTISVEAFRFATSRTKSTTSLGSLLDDAPLERPRFEPSKSRRSSFMSETSDSGASALAPPRPQYAAQHSRSSSNSSDASSRDVRGQQQQQQQGMGQYDSLASVASYSTAPERPAMSREASLDDELKLIAMYSTSPEISSRPLPKSASSPYISSLPFEADSSDLDIEHLRSTSPLSKSNPPSRSPRRNSAQGTPTSARQGSFALAVQPPTPVAEPSFIPPPQRPSAQSPTSSRGRTVSAMAATAGKGKAPAKGWNSDSSATEEDDSDDDDDVPLAKIQSRSQTNLALYSHQQSSSSNLMVRKGSSEVEVLAEPNRPPTPTAPKSPTQPTTRESLGRGTPPMSPSAFARSIPPLSPSASAAAALRRQGSQRRSVSTLSFSSPVVTSSPSPSGLHTPTLSLSGPPHPTLGYRSLSNPSSPAPAASHSFLPSSTSTSLVPSLSSSPVTTPTTSTIPTFQPRVVSSSSSGSGSGSSAPRTPKDLSPAVSDLGMKSSTSTARSSVLLGGSGDDERRQVKFADESPVVSLAGQAKNRMSAQPLHTPPSRANIGPPKSSSMANLHSTSASMGGAPRFAGSVNAFAQGHQPQKSSLSQSTPTTPTTPNASGSVFDRMKARHKAETLSAIALGKDLNGPEGAIADEEDDEDDDEPLSSLPARRGSNSQLGSLYASGGSMMGMPMQGQHQFGQQQFYGHAPQSPIGGYSPLAMAPPGVDPYLYASLPNDQKMQLHARSQQMMQMMAQAAYQAKAESQGGWETGSNVSGSSSNAGAVFNGGHQQRASFGNFNSGFPPMGMPMMGYGGMHPPQAVPSSPSSHSPYSNNSYTTMPRGARLPPFAPSFALSQPMFQPSVYAGSAIGAPTGGGSLMGMPTGGTRGNGGQGGRRAPASAIGTGRR